MSIQEKAMRILIVEDEEDLATILKTGLIEAGHAVDVAHAGGEALDWVATAPFDVIVLDILLPDMTGIEVCRALRNQRLHTPILLLTALDAVEDRVSGLDAGADDYLTKPFAFAELLARLRALNRRQPDVAPTILTFGKMRLDPASHQVWRDDQLVALSPREFSILAFLMQRPGRVATRSMIADHVWDYDFPNVTNVIDVHIRSLRFKLGDPVPGEFIQTIRGVGYRIGGPG